MNDHADPTINILSDNFSNETIMGEAKKDYETAIKDSVISTTFACISQSTKKPPKRTILYDFNPLYNTNF